MSKESNEQKFKEFLEQVKELFIINDIESNKKVIELVDNYLSEIPHSQIKGAVKSARKDLSLANALGILSDIKSDEEVKFSVDRLNIIKKNAWINLLKIELASTTSKKEQIRLQGKLIKEYSNLEKLEVDQEQKYAARSERVKLLKQQKELTKDYVSTDKNINIFEKTYYKVKSISEGIEAFVVEKDVIKKVGNVLKDTFTSSLFSALIITAFGLIGSKTIGLPFKFNSLKSVLPLTAYSAIYSSLKNFGGKTGFEQYEYYHSDEFQEYLKKFKEDNKDLLNEFASLISSKNDSLSNENIIEINQEIIKKIEEISSKTDVQGIKDAYALPALELLRENKKCCKEIIDEYLDEKNDDREKYVKYNNLLTKLNLQIFARANSLVDACKNAGKNVLNNSAIMIIAKAIITIFAPASSVAIKSINSLIIPLIYNVVNGLIDITTYSNKLKYKETSENVLVDPKDREAFKGLFNNSPQLSMA